MLSVPRKFPKNSSFCLNQVPSLCVRHYTRKDSQGYYFSTEILGSPYPLRLRMNLSEIIPSTLRIDNGFLKKTRIHYLNTPLFFYFFFCTRTKKPDLYPSLYPVSVPVSNCNQDVKRCFFNVYLYCLVVFFF